MNKEIFIKKFFPIIMLINCLYIWCMIVIGTLYIFGYNSLCGYIICLIAIGINVYTHVITYSYIAKKNESQDK